MQLALEDFCRATKYSTAVRRLHSPPQSLHHSFSRCNKENHEDSDLLANVDDLHKSMVVADDTELLKNFVSKTYGPKLLTKKSGVLNESNKSGKQLGHTPFCSQPIADPHAPQPHATRAGELAVAHAGP